MSAIDNKTNHNYIRCIARTPAPEINIKQDIYDLESGTGIYNFDNGWFNYTAVFTIENSGSEKLNLIGNPFVAISGLNANEFTITQPTTNSIDAGTSADFSITFSLGLPPEGIKSAIINIINDDSDESNYTFIVNGTYAKGKIWTQEKASAGWSGRCYHSNVVFNNKIWIIGGKENYGHYKNDVWSSSDGITWVQETSSAGWSARSDHTSAVFENKLWLMGGDDSDGFKNDIWSSSDGKTWSQVGANAGWDARGGHTSVVFQNKMWVLGGKSIENYREKNDVWWAQ